MYVDKETMDFVDQLVATARANGSTEGYSQGKNYMRKKFIETFPQTAVAYITFLNTCIANQPNEEERVKFVEDLFKDI